MDITIGNGNKTGNKPLGMGSKKTFALIPSTETSHRVKQMLTDDGYRTDS